ncbi:MAG TPA: rhomboid family intramembrane serine protease [Anseongella sp.]
MNYRPSFAPRMPIVVKNLLIINGLFFLATVLTNEQFMVHTFGAHYFDSDFFRVWQPITYMFMHGGFFHIFFNMYAVFLFGSAIESVWGPKRFLQYYIFTGLGALAIQMAVNAFGIYQMTGGFVTTPYTEGCAIVGNMFQCPPTSSVDLFAKANAPLIGASGAVFGLLLAFGMMFPNVELMMIFLPIPIKAKYFVILYGVMELFLGAARFEGDNVAHFAHLGGLVTGFILIKIWNIGKPKRFF